MLGDLAYYEYANTIYDEVIFDYMLNVIITHGSSRTAFESLIFGSNYSNDSIAIGSYELSDMGVGVLRYDDSFLLMDYGPHGGTSSFY